MVSVPVIIDVRNKELRENKEVGIKSGWIIMGKVG